MCEIAEFDNLTESTCESNVSRSREKLKFILVAATISYKRPNDQASTVKHTRLCMTDDIA